MIKGFILTPSFNHFTAALVNYEYNNNYMKKGKNYNFWKKEKITIMMVWVNITILKKFIIYLKI